jgi:hypothetical protein
MENKIKEQLIKLEELQKQSSTLKKMIKDQLLNNPDYVKLVGEIEKLIASKKKIISQVNADNKAELEKIDELAYNIKCQKQLISDQTFVKLLDKETIEVTDSHGMVMVPFISIKFKKTGDYKKPENNS